MTNWKEKHTRVSQKSWQGKQLFLKRLARVSIYKRNPAITNFPLVLSKNLIVLF